jgi:hypothetical protein
VLSVARHGHVLHPEIDAHRFPRGNPLALRDVHRETQPPVPNRILGEAPLLPFHSLEPLRLEHPQGVKSCEPFALDVGTRRRTMGCLIAVIENRVDLDRGRVEPSVGLALDLQAKRARERARHECIISFRRRSCSTTFRNSLAVYDVLWLR